MALDIVERNRVHFTATWSSDDRPQDTLIRIYVDGNLWAEGHLDGYYTATSQSATMLVQPDPEAGKETWRRRWTGMKTCMPMEYLVEWLETTGLLGWCDTADASRVRLTPKDVTPPRAEPLDF